MLITGSVTPLGLVLLFYTMLGSCCSAPFNQSEIGNATENHDQRDHLPLKLPPWNPPQFNVDSANGDIILLDEEPSKRLGSVLTNILHALNLTQEDESYLNHFWAIKDKDMPHKLDLRNFPAQTVAGCARSAFELNQRVAVWRDGRCYLKHSYPGPHRLLNRRGFLVGHYNVPFSDLDSPANLLSAETWSAKGKCDMIVVNEPYEEWLCKSYEKSPGAVMLFRREVNFGHRNVRSTSSHTNTHSNETAIHPSQDMHKRGQKLLDRDLLHEYWAVYDKDMPHKFDKRNFESPDVSSCARSALHDGEKLAIWRNGRCWYKHVSATDARIMNQHGLLLGKYNIPFSDIDSPVDIRTAKSWALSRRCDMIIANDGYEEFWCKKYVETPGAVMLFRFEDMQNEPPITSSRSSDGSYLEKFWSLSDKDMPHKLDKSHFETASASICARRAFEDGEKLAVYRHGRCYYKQVTGDSRLLNRYGEQVGRFNIPFSDINSPGDVKKAEDWMKHRDCDMIIVDPEWTEYWCKKYVDSPGTIMLFLKDYS